MRSSIFAQIALAEIRPFPQPVEKFLSIIGCYCQNRRLPKGIFVPGRASAGRVRASLRRRLQSSVGQRLSNRVGYGWGMKTETTDQMEMFGAVAAMAAESARARVAADGAVSDMGAGWMASHYLFALRQQLAAQPAGSRRFNLLQQAAGNVVAFQRGGVWAARVELERERLEFQRQKHRDKMSVLTQPTPPHAGAYQGRRALTDEELKACVDQVDEIMGLKPAGK